MNRRDIIIVAVLINTGLLVTLFVTSLSKEKEIPLVSAEPVSHKKVEMVAKLSPPPPAPIEKKASDPVDQVIKQYSEKVAVEVKEEKAPLPVLTPPKKEEEKVPVKAPVRAPLRVVTVEKGDVLEKIARSHGVSVDEIMKLNNLTNSRLQIGQELKLPEKKIPMKKEEIKKEDEGKYYVIKGGDSPWTIAQKHHMQVEELLKLNNIDEEKAKRLRPGDRLRIK
ncbi:MAG: LysM peptidoglycan-binding domain-containing protein [Chlamydiia bacterium]|nr:LysM peptidoglycan-binding domain-containing protein [Chlamydiia bacterium]